MKIKEFLKRNRLILSFAFLTFCLALFMMLFLVKESDYFWHIKVGEYIFKKGILKKDIFSWYMRNKYWMSHEWLFEYILYFLHYLFGNYHMIIYAFGCLLSLFFILFLSNKDKLVKNIPFSLLWITLSLILIVFMQARPHLLSFNFLALTIWFLYDLYKNEDSKKLYFLPLITILWSNVHGGSSNLSYLFCLLFLIGGLFSFEVGKIKAKRISKKQILKYLVIMIICMGCVCINIHGFKMFIYPYQNMLNTVMIQNINEWQPTTLGEIAHYPYFLFIIIIMLILLISKRKIELIDFLLLGVSVFLGLKSIRFWGYTYIVVSFFIFNYVEKRKEDKLSTLVIFIVGMMFLSIFLINKDMMKTNLNKKYLDSTVIKVIRKEKPERLYNMYNYGGELIYNKIDVFIDGRADLYSGNNYSDYLNLSNLKDDFVKIMEKYNFDYYLVDNSYPIYTYLKYNDDFLVIYKDKKTTLFKKKEKSL